LRISLAGLLLIVLVQGVFAEEPCTLIKMWDVNDGRSNTTANGVAVDASDNVYVTDTASSRVRHYSTDGSILSYWDIRDTENGLFGHPWGVAVDSSHNVYITDRENHTVQKLTWRGSSVWGSEGTGTGQFSHPTGISVDRSGNVYVADTDNNRIQVFHSTGTYLVQWGSYGTVNGQFIAPTDIAVDSTGTMYVADSGNHRIQKISPAGTFLATWGSEGTGDGQFYSPAGIALDPGGNVYVADDSGRIQKFSPAGEYLSTCETGGRIHDVAIDSSGYIYALSYDAPSWKIAIYGTPVSIPTQTTAPPPRTPRPMIVTPAVPTTLQDRAVQTEIPVTPATGITTAPTATPATIVSQALVLNNYNTTIAASGGQVPAIDIQKDILVGIMKFFRDLFGGQ